MKIPESVQIRGEIDTYIDSASWKDSWKAAKENTSSGPSGLHFGHFKADALVPHLAELDATMANIPIITGYTPKRWRRGLNVMIEKKEGGMNVEKMRIILLYEADFNQVNKIVAKRLMDRAEEEKALAPEQYGSQKGKSAIQHLLNKRLT